MEKILAKDLPMPMQELRTIISEHLDEIKSLFKDGRVTLIVRSPSLPDGTVLMSDDDIEEAIKAARKAMGDLKATHVPPDSVN